MTTWVRFQHANRAGFRTLSGGAIAVHDGDMFAGARATGKTLGASDVRGGPAWYYRRKSPARSCP